MSTRPEPLQPQLAQPSMNGDGYQVSDTTLLPAKRERLSALRGQHTCAPEARAGESECWGKVLTRIVPETQSSPPHYDKLNSPSPGGHPAIFTSPSLSRGSGDSPSLSPLPRGLDQGSMPFSDSPSTELPPIQSHTDKFASASNNTTLPSLSSVTGGAPPPLPPLHQRQPEPIKHWPSLNPLTAFYAPSHVEPPKIALSMAASPDRSYEQRAGSVNLDDPDVRAAAEALGELRAGMFCSLSYFSHPESSRVPLYD